MYVQGHVGKKYNFYFCPISKKLMSMLWKTAVAIKKTRHLVNLPYKAGISN